ncbi:MAG: RluA family pseudouridine synthase [Acidobacteriota bacterium]
MRAAILYEDDHLLAVNKPSGLSLATSAREVGAAVRRLLGALPAEQRRKLESGGGGPWLLHRLDVSTSGVVLLARSAEAQRLYSGLLSARAVEKCYLALAWGRFDPPEGRLDWPLGPDRGDRRRMAVDPGGKRAVTLYRTLQACAEASLLEFRLETGRTHQIRVHASHAGHPLLGDDLYGRLRDLPPGLSAARRSSLQPGRCLLHAFVLSVPATVLAPALTVAAPPPEDFAGICRLLNLIPPRVPREVSGPPEGEG